MRQGSRATSTLDLHGGSLVSPWRTLYQDPVSVASSRWDLVSHTSMHMRNAPRWQSASMSAHASALWSIQSGT